MEWTEDEIRAVSVEECRDAINSVLERAMVHDGRLDVAKMERTQIDYAIHLLRQYKAIKL